MNKLQKYAVKKIKTLSFDAGMEIYKQREKLGGESSEEYKQLKAAIREIEELAAGLNDEQ